MQDIGIVLVIILILVLLWRGPKTLPQLGNALGRGVREARDEASKAQAEIQSRAAGEPGDGESADVTAGTDQAATDQAPAAEATPTGEPTPTEPKDRTPPGTA